MDRICIVGGGTSAWLTAAHLSNNLDQEIVVIDSKFSKTVEVGEATLPTFIEFWKECGFSGYDLFNEVDATIKAGILFKNWQEEGKNIWHPFYRGQNDIWDDNPLIQRHAFKYELWSKDQSCDVKYSMGGYDRCVLHNRIEPEQLAYSIEINDIVNQLSTVHINCKKIVEYIQRKLKSKVKFIQSAVKDISGNVKSLKLEDGQVIHGDLFIDCTGFKSILKKQKRVTLYNRLFCDTAVASHIPYEDQPNELRPYTTCESVEHGWVWNIPLENNIGSGLVYNREITDTSKAIEYFINYWDNRITEDLCKVIDWTPYYIENFWENNVVSIGLSGGFLEPLESTGIATMTMQIQNLYGLIREGWYTERDVALYNNICISSYERNINFVNLHYHESKKTGVFWDHVRQNHIKSDTQKHYENFLKDPYMKMHPPSYYNRSPFAFESWICIMSQMNFDKVPKKTNDHTPIDKNIHYYRILETNIEGVDYPTYLKEVIKNNKLLWTGKF